MPSRGRSFLVISLTVLLFRTRLVAQAPTGSVRPGSVAVWEGLGVTRCGSLGENWAAREGRCYFPVDLGHPEGTVEVWRSREGRREVARLVVLRSNYPEQRIELPDDTHVTLSEENAERARREASEVARVFAERTPVRAGFPFAAPLESLPDARNFGVRRFFNGQPRRPHSGADYSAPKGTVVRASAGGRVRLARSQFFSGNSVYVDHGDGLFSMYFHLDTLFVKAGDEVGPGHVLGTVGATGRASGPHLHFGIVWRGARIDPRPLLGDPAGLSRIEP